MTDKRSSDSNKPEFRLDLNFKDQILRELGKATAKRDEKIQSLNTSESEPVEVIQSEEKIVEEIIDLDELSNEKNSDDTSLHPEIEAIVAEIESNFEPPLSDEENEQINEEKFSSESQQDEVQDQDDESSSEDTIFVDIEDDDPTIEDEDIPLESSDGDEGDVIEDETSSIDSEVEADNSQVTKKGKTKKNKKEKDRNMKIKDISNRIVLILVSIIVIVALLLGFMGWRYVSSGIKPLDSKSNEYVQVEIPEGSGNRLIGQILEESGIIKSGTIFNYYTKFNNHTNFLSGYYNLQPSMSLDEIIEALQEGGTSEPSAPVLGKILIPEGYTIDQISEAIAVNANSKKNEASPFTSKEFLSVVTDSSFISKMVEKYPTLLANLPSKDDATYQLEGYLFPATYDYYEDMTMEELVEEMIAAMDRNLAVYYEDIETTGFDVNEILTLASLIEKEGSTDEDRKNIAGVFVNRINQDIPLGSNISILYITGQLGSSSTTLADDASIDTTIDSPYNTYQNLGLMPGPVDSPGISAIKAAITPNSTDDLYFVADVTTGDVYFAEDLETHEENVEKYVNSKLESSSSTDQSSSN